MLDVVIALIPVVMVAIFFFGYLVIVNLVVCVLACFASESLFGVIAHKGVPNKDDYKSSVYNLSFAITGILLALNLPTVTDVWGWHIYSGGTIVLSLDTIIICIVVSIFSIVVCKMLFGGLGRNFANPAMAGRVFLLLAITSAMTATQTNPLFGADIGMHLSSGASWLGMSGDGVYNTALSEQHWILWDMLIGNTSSAAVGETSVVAIALGYTYLVVKKRIDWRVPLILIGATAVFALLLGIGDARVEYDSISVVFGYMVAHMLSGGLIFGAVFMATDYSTSPNSFWGNVVFVVGIAFFTVLIRLYANWYEGFSFGLLLCNVAVPMIDRYIYPRPFGYIKRPKVNA
jgi:electron transport complex protein RnfD